MSGVVDVDLTPLDYPGRLAALLAGGAGLWDVVATASRAGSLDGAIRNHTANALAAFVASLPDLRAIAFNGGKAAAIGRPLLAASGAVLIDLPSSSPAFTLALDAKRERWRRLREYL